MSRKVFVFKAILFYLTCLVIFPVHASEGLVFNQPLSERSKRLIENFIHKNDKGDLRNLKIARADLNKDGLDEFIVKTNNCDRSYGMCDFDILAETGNTITSLGTITARDIILGNRYSKGVRNLLAFQSETNDFDYKVYAWESTLSRYILSE